MTLSELIAERRVFPPPPAISFDETGIILFRDSKRQGTVVCDLKETSPGSPRSEADNRRIFRGVIFLAENRRREGREGEPVSFLHTHGHGHSLSGKERFFLLFSN